jgi:hypothetical protein
MLRLVSDADYNGIVIRGLLRRQVDLDLIRVQEVGVRTAGDPDILAWAAVENRILLTHDRTAMTDHAYERIRLGYLMPGVFVQRNRPPFGPLIDEILLIVACSSQADWIDRVVFLPL